MRSCFVTDRRSLADELSALDGDPGTEAILVLTASDGLSPDAVADLLDGCCTPTFGGVFPAVLDGGTRSEDGAAVVGLPAVSDVTTVTGLDDPDTDLGAQLDSTLVDGAETAFTLVDAHADRVAAFVRTLFDTYGVDIDFLGGGAGRLDPTDGRRLYTPDGTARGGAVVGFVPTPYDIGVRHGWRPIAGPFRITDATGRTLHGLDGRPAFEVYRQAVSEHHGTGPDSEQFFRTAKQYPFGISRLDGEPIVRDPFEVTADGSIECFGALPEGEFLHVLHGDADSLVPAAATAHEDTTAGRGSAGTPLVCFDCVSRVLSLGSAFAEELAALGASGEPTTGALTIGEIANDRYSHLDFYNKTVVAARPNDR